MRHSDDILEEIDAIKVKIVALSAQHDILSNSDSINEQNDSVAVSDLISDLEGELNELEEELDEALDNERDCYDR